MAIGIYQPSERMQESGGYHEKGEERPLLVLVLAADAAVSAHSIEAPIEGK